MEFPISFICASHNYADFDRQVPAPYLRRSFMLDKTPEQAEVLVTGLGFYRIFINGTEITKGILAPYISNPDDVVYYDRYDLTGLLESGENVIGLILGNGMQNCFGGFVWDFDKTRWRGAPMTALRLSAKLPDEKEFTLESDSSFCTHPSPVLFDDLRCGEYYDARREIPGWCSPGFDDSFWDNALPATPPRGELRLCTAEPIVTSRELAPVSVTPYQDGYLYDFGINSAGRVRLRITGTPGQEVRLFHGEWFHDGVLEQKNINFGDRGDPRFVHVQRSRYTCRGQGEEVYAPYFTYAGFRYVYVTGITPEQAVPELLTFEIMHSSLKEVGTFSCSDETVNKLQACTRCSDLSNFYYFPTDCPHREKNGWTGDAALSAEHMLLNLSVETSFREWLRSIRKAQGESGILPGIVPTGGAGYTWGNGPAWDAVLTYLPYFTWKYRGDLEIVRENATAIFRYLHYLTTRMDKDGLLAIGLGDWCPPGRAFDAYKSPLILTDSIISMDIAEKAAQMFGAIGWEMQKNFAEQLAARLKASVRANLIDFSSMTAAGACQTSQAMALFYNIFEGGERPAAFARLLELIDDMNGHMDTGILGARVIFHVLSDFDRTDLALNMIARPDYPSYGNWIARGATSLWEEFQPEDGPVNSLNHHFYGDISSWFIQALAGLVLNPKGDDCTCVNIAPHFAEKLQFAEASHFSPSGRIFVRWERAEGEVLLTLEVPETMHGFLTAPKGWTLTDGLSRIPVQSGTFHFVPAHA